MKFAKRVVAALIAAILAFSMVACHEAKEVVASYDDIEITGGMYLAMLLEADGTARTLADEQNETDTAIDDYGDVKIKTDDGEVKYYDYVKDEAKKLIRQFIATATLSDEYEVTLSDEDKAGLDAYISYIWDTYGYGVMYEENGVGRSSYTEYLKNSGYLRGNLFNAIYGKEGKTPVKEEELKKYMNENYCIANIISEPLSSTDENGNTFTLTEDEQKDLLGKLNAYADRLTKGDADFETIYHEHSGTEHKDEDTADTTDTEDTADTTDTADTASSDAETAEDEDAAPTQLDSHATLLSSEETGSESENFDEIYKMKTGEVKVIQGEDAYTLVVKGDIAADPYYLYSLDDTLRQLIKSDEFNNLLDEEGGKLDIKYNEGEISYLSPKKINYDVY